MIATLTSLEHNTGACKAKNNSKPLGPQVVSDLLSIVEKSACHRVYFDNFFTSYLLLRDLHEKGFKALGTIRENRTTKCPLSPQHQLNKKNVNSLTTAQTNVCP